MPVLRFIVFFLIGVGVTIGAYAAGVAQRVPGWLGYDVIVETPVVITPPVAVTVPGDGTLVTAPPAIVTPGGPAVVDIPPGQDPIDDDVASDYPTNGYPTDGYPTNGYPVNGEAMSPTKSEAVFANGSSPLRVNIFRSETGFEARCTGYKIVNRSQRVLMLSFDPRRGEGESVAYDRQGTLLKPGETLDEDSFPVECVEFRSLFTGEGSKYGPPEKYGHRRGFGGPIVKIEIEDCPHDNCAVAQF